MDSPRNTKVVLEVVTSCLMSKTIDQTLNFFVYLFFPSFELISTFFADYQCIPFLINNWLLIMEEERHFAINLLTYDNFTIKTLNA